MKQKSYYQLKSRLVKDQQYTEIIKDESLSIARKNAYEILCIHTTQLIQQGLIQWYTHRYPVLQTIHDLEIFNYYNPSFKSEKMFPDVVSLYFCIWNEDTESYRSLCIFKIGILEMGDYKLILENSETEFKYFQSQDHIAQLPISTIDPYWYTGMKDRFADRPKRIIQTPIDWKYNNCIARFQLENSSLFALQKFKRDRVAFLTNTKKPNIKNELFSLFNTYGGFLYIGIDYKRNYFPIKDYLLD